jgi:nitroreductase
MTQMSAEALKAFRKVFDGELITPDQVGYDAIRTLWNAQIDRRPALIARCVHTPDVAASVNFGREQGMEISVRCGSHNAAGTAVCEGGLMIDLSLMREVRVDAAARRVRVAGGALLGDMDTATQAHGLATTAGTVSHTGVGGLTLGGGFGWLGRRHGPAADNLVSAEVVAADGRILRASERDNPDLFWALRGGGGNFGVVTEFEFRLHEVGPEIDFGMFFYGLGQGGEAVRLGRDLMTAASRDTTVFLVAVNAPPEEFVPARYRFQPGYAIMLAGFDGDEHARLCQHIRAAVPPVFEHVDRMPYIGLQQMLDEANAWGRYCYEKGAHLGELSDAAIDVIVEHVPRKTSALSYVVLASLDGGYEDVAAEESAVAALRSGYAAFVVGLTEKPDQLAAERNWVRGLWDALLPHARGVGAYINTFVELDADRIKATYGPAKYARLAEIKRRYDPDNLFHLNANIKPA